MFKFQPASVALSGPGFSFLIHETNNATVGQYGFLLGEIVHKKEINSITDNDQVQVDISKIIKINSAVPWPCRNYFPNGRVDKEKIRKFLGNHFSKVVAWYKYGSIQFRNPSQPQKLSKKLFQKIDIENTIGVVSVTQIENSVRDAIIKTVLELKKAEKYLFKLEEEIKLLRETNQAVERPQTIEDEVMDTSFECTSLNEEKPTEKLSERTETSPRRSQRTNNVPDSNRRNSQLGNLPNTPTPLKGYGRASGKAKPRGTRGGK
ncbi:unnamed protein product [Ceutorhynchus assimilis]|uniref:Uncharacterized protein n=1 Tax=Ceutorhynchus assimilis TaxID=467358 RepID=A0A9N9MJ54_9CUCU|nr:unnamed protein product [Ceutorhynchus assimilis]